MRYTYEDDFSLMRSLGAQTYRLSLSWSRMMKWDAALGKMVRNPQGVVWGTQSQVSPVSV